MHNLPTNYAYVACYRERSFDDMLFLKHFEFDFLNNPPNENLVNDYVRLRNLEQKTISEYEKVNQLSNI
jgi:hypothetical protein